MPHHTCLHKERETEARKPSKEPAKSVMSHTSPLTSPQQQVLLMTCQLHVVTANCRVTKARALLDSLALTSFIMERLAQHLQLTRICHYLQFSRIRGADTPVAPQGIVQFGVASISHIDEHMPVEAVVLPRITTELPVQHIPFDGKWRHLKGLHLADPDFSIPGSVDLLLGADLLGAIIRHGQRQGPPGMPSAIETCSFWLGACRRCKGRTTISYGADNSLLYWTAGR